MYMHMYTYIHTCIFKLCCMQVVFKPCSGVLGQLVVFDFGSFFLVRSVLVQSCSQEEADLLESSSSELLLDSQETDRPAKP